MTRGSFTRAAAEADDPAGRVALMVHHRVRPELASVDALQRDGLALSQALGTGLGTGPGGLGYPLHIFFFLPAPERGEAGWPVARDDSKLSPGLLCGFSHCGRGRFEGGEAHRRHRDQVALGTCRHACEAVPTWISGILRGSPLCEGTDGLGGPLHLKAMWFIVMYALELMA